MGGSERRRRKDVVITGKRFIGVHHIFQNATQSDACLFLSCSTARVELKLLRPTDDVDSSALKRLYGVVCVVSRRFAQANKPQCSD